MHVITKRNRNNKLYFTLISYMIYYDLRYYQEFYCFQYNHVNNLWWLKIGTLRFKPQKEVALHTIYFHLDFKIYSFMYNIQSLMTIYLGYTNEIDQTKTILTHAKENLYNDHSMCTKHVVA